MQVNAGTSASFEGSFVMEFYGSGHITCSFTLSADAHTVTLTPTNGCPYIAERDESPSGKGFKETITLKAKK